MMKLIFQKQDKGKNNTVRKTCESTCEELTAKISDKKVDKDEVFKFCPLKGKED